MLAHGLLAGRDPLPTPRPGTPSGTLALAVNLVKVSKVVLLPSQQMVRLPLSCGRTMVDRLR